MQPFKSLNLKGFLCPWIEKGLSEDIWGLCLTQDSVQAPDKTPGECEMIKSMNIGWWVERWSQLHPEKAAIIFDGLGISYSELHRRVNHTACWLQSMGIQKGDRVAVMMRNCPEFVEVFLACARLGAIFVPINFRLTARELAHIVGNAEPRIFIFDAQYAETVGELRSGYDISPPFLCCLGQDVVIDEMIDYLGETGKFCGQTPLIRETAGPMDPEEPQVIMYTSGTTGLAKGAVLSYRKTFFNSLNADIFFDLCFDDIMLIVMPLFHSGGLFIQASPILYKGGTIVIQASFDPEMTYRDIRWHRVTKFLGVPTIYRTLIDSGYDQERDLSSLRVSAIGGEKATPELLAHCRRAGFPVRQIMGQTETSILFWASEDDDVKKPGTVGRPVFHADVSLMDPKGRPVKPGEVGEIAVRGAIMMTEYWQDPEKTRETVRNGWLYTGDLARMDEEGYFYLVDRARDMYISGGENVYPAEVEAILREHPDVNDIAVVGISHEIWGEVGKAFIISENDADLSIEQLHEYCRGRMAPYKWPREIMLCKDFPRTTLGKVKKRLLAR